MKLVISLMLLVGALGAGFRLLGAAVQGKRTPTVWWGLLFLGLLAAAPIIGLS